MLGKQRFRHSNIQLFSSVADLFLRTTTPLYACSATTVQQSQLITARREHGNRTTKNVVVVIYFIRLVRLPSTSPSQLYTGLVGQHRTSSNRILELRPCDTQMGNCASLGEPHVLASFHLHDNLGRNARA